MRMSMRVVRAHRGYEKKWSGGVSFARYWCFVVASTGVFGVGGAGHDR